MTNQQGDKQAKVTTLNSIGYFEHVAECHEQETVTGESLKTDEPTASSTKLQKSAFKKRPRSPLP